MFVRRGFDLDKSWTDCLNSMEQLVSSALVEGIKKAYQAGFSYEEIYTALHKAVDLVIYEWEIDKFL